MEHISKVVNDLMVGLGGKLCEICSKEWHSKNDTICYTCDENATKLLNDVKGWRKIDL